MFVEGVIAVSAFLFSALLTRAMIAYAQRRRLLDIPNRRSSHSAPTPRGGGFAVVAVSLAGLIALHARGLLPLDACLALAGSGAIAGAIGFRDDLGHVSARYRVLVHFLAAGWALYWLGGFPYLGAGLTLSGAVQNLFWLVALVWFLNTYNFMDGIDAVAGAEAVFIAVASGTLLLLSGAGDLAMVAFLLMGGTAGFLLWNLPPARIFMGDVGSGFLGIVLGVLAIVSVRQGSLSMWVWTILFGAFIVDATMTVARRMMRGARWYCAHRCHAYQHAARMLGSHGLVTGAITGINVLWLFPLALAAWHWPDMGAIFALIAYGPLVWLCWYFDAGLDEENEEPLATTRHGAIEENP